MVAQTRNILSWSLVIILAKDINTDPYCYMAMYPDMALSGSVGWDFTMVSVGREGYPHQAIPLHA